MRTKLISLLMAFLVIMLPFSQFGCGVGSDNNGSNSTLVGQSAPVEIFSPFFTSNWHETFGSDYHTVNEKDFNRGSGDDDCGEPLAAVCTGSIKCSPHCDSSGKCSLYGNRCTITCDSNSLGFKQAFYAHLQGYAKPSGRVCGGERIGEVGKTGGDWTCHLHMEVKDSAGQKIPFQINLNQRAQCKECSYVSQSPDKPKYTNGRFDVEQGGRYLIGFTVKNTGSSCWESHPTNKYLAAAFSIDKSGKIVDSYVYSKKKWDLLTGGTNKIRAAHLYRAAGTSGRVCPGQYGFFQIEIYIPKGLKIGDVNVYFSPGYPNQGNRLMMDCLAQRMHIPLRVHCAPGAKLCAGSSLFTCSADRLSWIQQRCNHGCSNESCNPPPPSAPPPPPNDGCRPGQRECKNGVETSCDQNQNWTIKTKCLCGCQDKYACLPHECIPNQQECKVDTHRFCSPKTCKWVETPCQYGCDQWTCKSAPPPPTCPSVTTRCSGNDLETCANGKWTKSTCQHGCSNGACSAPPPPTCPTSAKTSCTANQAVCAGSGCNDVWLCTDTGGEYIHQRNCSQYGGCSNGKCVNRPTTCTVTLDKTTHKISFTNIAVTEICMMCRDRSCGNTCVKASSATVPAGRDFIYTDNWRARECKLVGICWCEERKSSGGQADGGYFCPCP